MQILFEAIEARNLLLFNYCMLSYIIVISNSMPQLDFSFLLSN